VCARVWWGDPPEPAQSKIIASLFATGMALRMIVFCLDSAAGYCRLVCSCGRLCGIVPPRTQGVSAPAAPPALASPRTHRKGSPLRRGKEERRVWGGRGTCVGLARTVYIHRIWPYIWWFPCQNYRIYTVYIGFWPTLQMMQPSIKDRNDGQVLSESSG